MSDQFASCFFSYARSDDEREFNRISRIALKIGAEFETLTGSKIEIFIDRDDIKWGEGFRRKLDEALQSTTFFIPVLTPTYFLRDECRNEMMTFVTKAKALGLQDLLMSIRYVQIPDLVVESIDELKAVSANMQYEDWSDLRLLDEESSEYRSGISRLTRRLIEVTHQLEGRVNNFEATAHATVSITSNVIATLDQGLNTGEIAAGPESKKPGFLDLFEDLQSPLANWAETMIAYAKASVPFTDAMDRATNDFEVIHEKPNSFALEVVRARRLALELDQPLQKMEELSKEYSSRIMILDPLIQLYLSQIEIEIETGVLEMQDIPLRLDSLNSLKGITDGSLAAMDAADILANLAKVHRSAFRNLRPIWRRFQASSRNFSDVRYVIENWDDYVNKLIRELSLIK